jgi:hypothetical protein
MLGGPQGRSGQVRKISIPPGFDPRTVQPVASRYTDWAIRPTIIITCLLNFILMCLYNTTGWCVVGTGVRCLLGWWFSRFVFCLYFRVMSVPKIAFFLWFLSATVSWLVSYSNWTVSNQRAFTLQCRPRYSVRTFKSSHFVGFGAPYGPEYI